MKIEETPIEKFQDGLAALVELQGELYLTVTPPRWVGKPIEIEDVWQKIEKKNVKNIKVEIVKKVVDTRMGEPIRITGDSDSVDLDRLRERGDRDGFACIISKKDGLCLSVHPPKGKGIRLEYEYVEEYFRESQYIGVDYDLARKVVGTATGEEVKLIVKSKEALAGALKEVLEIAVSEDSMVARITLQSNMKNGVPFDHQMILKELRERGVVYGIDRGKIEELLLGKHFGKEAVVARGDSNIVYGVDIPLKKEPRIVQDEKADYYLRDGLPLVKKGQRLITKNPNVEARRGRNVRGEEIRQKSMVNLESMRGKNILISDDGKELRAAICGYVYFLEGRIHVEYEYMLIKRNVDPSIGDIYFEGEIFIGGSILPGSKVRAVGNIEVLAGVRKAKITSIEGNVKARVSESSFIIAKGDILIEEEAVDSTLITCGRVIVEGERGIVGGKTKAGVEIKAVNVGSRDAPLTELFIIHPQAYERDRELLNLEESVEDLKEKLVSLGEKLNMGKEKDHLFREMNRYFSLKKEVDALTSRKERLKNEKIPKIKEWKIEVTDTVYPGVVIYVDDSNLNKNEDLKKVCY